MSELSTELVSLLEDETGVNYYPMDFAALKKGDVISISRIEQVTGIKRDHAQFAMESMKLAHRIQCEMRSRGSNARTRIKDRAIEIMTDIAALEYSMARCEKIEEKQGVEVRELGRINGAGFSDEDKTRLDRERILQSSKLLAMRQAKKAIKSKGEVMAELLNPQPPSVPKIN